MSGSLRLACAVARPSTGEGVRTRSPASKFKDRDPSFREPQSRMWSQQAPGATIGRSEHSLGFRCERLSVMGMPRASPIARTQFTILRSCSGVTMLRAPPQVCGGELVIVIENLVAK